MLWYWILYVYTVSSYQKYQSCRCMVSHLVPEKQMQSRTRGYRDLLNPVKSPNDVYVTKIQPSDYVFLVDVNDSPCFTLHVYITVILFCLWRVRPVVCLWRERLWQVIDNLSKTLWIRYCLTLQKLYRCIDELVHIICLDWFVFST
jgi:hypothetical protein